MNPLEQRWFKIKSYETFPVKVKYYGDCGLPLEYVEYLPDALRDQALEVFTGYLQCVTSSYSDRFQEAKNDDGLSDVMKDMTVDESSDKKKQKRGGKAAVKAKKKVEPGDVKVGRVSRGKKKSVTHITGLLTYEIDLKKTAKLFGGKFACGTSSNEKADEIVIQGTVSILLLKCSVTA